jgi:hypothetical protein
MRHKSKEDTDSQKRIPYQAQIRHTWEENYTGKKCTQNHWRGFMTSSDCGYGCDQHWVHMFKFGA